MSLIEAVSQETTQEQQTQQESVIQAEIDAPAIEKPEWLNDKYMANDRGIDEATTEQAKAYNELHKKFGGFTGAPDEYEFSLPEGTEGEIDTELGAYKEFQALAKESNMSNDTAQKLFNIFVGYQQSSMQQLDVDVQQQKELLGNNADARLSSLSGWAMNNLPQENMDAFASMVTTRDQVEAMEALIGRTRNTKMADTQSNVVMPNFTESDFQRAVQSDRYMKDPEYRKEIRKKAEAILPG